MTLDETDADRLLLLDRIDERILDLDLGQHEIEWTKLPDGAEAGIAPGRQRAGCRTASEAEVPRLPGVAGYSAGSRITASKARFRPAADCRQEAIREG
jgi:hypothetical protein